MAQPKTIQEVETPCFLIDIDKVQENCKRMRERCERLDVKLRPHMKTHKTIEIGEIMTYGEKKNIAVSTVKEAEYFADAGFDDILYAYIFSVEKLPRLKALQQRLNSFHLMLDNEYALNLLESNSATSEKKWSVFLKIDVGYRREGIAWESDSCIDLAEKITKSKNVVLKGLYTHEGHAYSVQGANELNKVGNEVTRRLCNVNERLKAVGIENLEVTMGSTPSCSQPGDMTQQLTEIHPGNYALYDVQQSLIGSCNRSDIAGRVATRVLAHYPLRNQMIIDAGFLALSHDGGKNPHDTIPNGSIAVIDGHSELRFFRMSQEVGVVEPVDGELNFDAHPIGSLLFMFPYHACATAAMHDRYYLHSGENITQVIYPCR